MKATCGVALILVLAIPKFAVAQNEEQTEPEQPEIEQADAGEE